MDKQIKATNMSSFKPTSVASIMIDGMSNAVENAVIENYLLSNYSMSIDNLTIKKDKIPLFLEDIKNHKIIKVQDETKLTDVTFDYGNGDIFKIFEYNNEEIGYYININSLSEDIYLCAIFCKSVQISSIIFDIYKKYEHTTSVVSVVINTIAMHGSNINFKSNTAVKTSKDFEKISKSYYPFLNTDEMFKQYLKSKDKLLILSGETGTGKTKIIDLMLNYTLNNSNLLGYTEADIENGLSINVAYIKNTSILSVDSLWSHLNTSSYDFIVLDDMDDMLADRNSVVTSHEDDSRKKFISQFLSFTDGLFNKKTKFIITTNQDIGTVDKAILRKGRCFDILSFRKLHLEECRNIWLENDLPESDFDTLFHSETEISACDIGSKIDNYKNTDSTEITPYVLEEGISIIKKITNKKIKIGG
jgi:hypothetical protein